MEAIALEFPLRNRLAPGNRSALRLRAVTRLRANAHHPRMDIGRIIDEELAAASTRIRARIAAEVMGLDAPPVVRTAPRPTSTVTPATYKAPPRGRMTRNAVADTRAAVLALFKPKLEINAETVRKALKLDRHRATLALNALVEAKAIKRLGVKRGTRYVLA